MNERRYQLRRVWGAFFEQWDVLLCPVSHRRAAAYAAGRDMAVARRGERPISSYEMLFWPGVTCGYHLPASTAPTGMTQVGPPISVQIVDPFHGDRTTIHVAGLLERHWRSFVPPAGWE
jgi:amidase